MIEHKSTRAYCETGESRCLFRVSNKEKKMMLDRIALKRQGSPNDIAEAVLFLANAKYITGQVIIIDGGRSLNQ